MTVYNLPRDRNKKEAEGRGWRKKVRRGREQEVRQIWGQFRQIKQQAQGRAVPDFGNNRGKREGWRETGSGRATGTTVLWELAGRGGS